MFRGPVSCPPSRRALCRRLWSPLFGAGDGGLRPFLLSWCRHPVPQWCPLCLITHLKAHLFGFLTGKSLKHSKSTVPLPVCQMRRDQMRPITPHFSVTSPPYQTHSQRTRASSARHLSPCWVTTDTVLCVWIPRASAEPGTDSRLSRDPGQGSINFVDFVQTPCFPGVLGPFSSTWAVHLLCLWRAHVPGFSS